MHTPVLGSKLLPPSHLSAHAAAQIRKLTGYHRNAPQLLPWQHTAVTMATPVKNTTGRCDNNGRVILMRGEPRDHIGHPSPPQISFLSWKPFPFCLSTSMWSRDFLPLLPSRCLHGLIQKNEKSFSVSCQCSTTIVKRMKQATLFWLSCSKCVEFNLPE